MRIKIDLHDTVFNCQLSNGDVSGADTSVEYYDRNELIGETTEFVVTLCERLLEALPALLDGEDIRLPYRAYPGALRLIPENGTLRIVTDLEKTREEDPEADARVPLDEFAVAVLRVSTQLVDYIEREYPDLKNDTAVEQLREALSTARDSGIGIDSQ